MPLPGEKLLHPSKYGAEEWLIVILLIFIVFVIIKHLIFHTLYFWWYHSGQFYIPNKFWTIITGKTLGERIVTYVKEESEEFVKSKPHIDNIINAVNDYFKVEEFAPSLGEVKGKILDEAVVACRPDTVLIIGCHIGYCVLRILRCIPKDAVVLVIEKNMDYLTAAKQLVSMVGTPNNVKFVCGDAAKIVPSIHIDYRIDKFDFVFLNRISRSEPSHVPAVRLLEGGGSQGMHCYFHQFGKSKGEIHRRTMLVADKVVMLGDPEFLKYVRLSNSYETKYHQMPLEYSPEDIIDGMEVVVYVG